MSLKQLLELSHEFGTQQYVLAGGGNTSLKEGGVMLVKASGTTLAGLDEKGLVRMDMPKLKIISRKEYPEDEAAREEMALEDLMKARCDGEEGRPSVEALLHSLFPETYVVHTHPSLVNGLTCSARGKETAGRLFGDKMLWIPVVNPGYILAKTVRDAMKECKTAPRFIFLENHGVFISGNTPDEIREKYKELLAVLNREIKREPEMNPTSHTIPSACLDLLKTVEEETGFTSYRELTQAEVLRFTQSRESFQPLSLAFTPDHIVYYGHQPLWLEKPDLSELKSRLAEYRKSYSNWPRIYVFRGIGVIAAGTSEKKADLAEALFIDGVSTAVYTESFGGHRFMDRDKIDFIVNWEVEKYRAQVSS